MRVTMRDIARAANVSVTTVSNVLRGQGRASEETRALVVSTAEELGYFRHNRPAATGLLGLIFCARPERSAASGVTESTPADFASYYTSSAIEGIQSITKEHGYELLFHIVNPFDGGDDELPPMITQRTVEGVLLIGGSIRDDYIRAIHQRGIPLVVVFTHVEDATIDAVLADNEQGARLATKHLIDQGHTRIGFINAWDVTRTSAAKLAGFHRAHAERDLPVDNTLCTEADFTFEGGYEKALQLLRSPNPPTALFVADDVMAFGAIRAAQELGRNIPSDLAVVGFGDNPLAAKWHPPLSTVQVPKRRIGELSAKRLIELLGNTNASQEPALRVAVATRLIERESSRASRVALSSS